MVVILAVLKFSTSPSISGLSERRAVNPPMIISMGVVSLVIKYGKNFILSKSGFVAVGLEDPPLWRRIRCTNTIAVKARGIRMCRDRNRLRVGCETEKFPQSH